MQLLPLLGKYLKDDVVIDILDGLEMDVIYDFDRLHEGQPDKYWAASKRDGIALVFDATQALEVVFLHIAPNDGFAAFSQSDCDVPFFATAAAVQAFAETQRLRVSKGKAELFGISRDWVRLEYAHYSVHYELHDGNLALVTITRV